MFARIMKFFGSVLAETLRKMLVFILLIFGVLLIVQYVLKIDIFRFLF